jgi:hypothetical protein
MIKEPVDESSLRPGCSCSSTVSPTAVDEPVCAEVTAMGLATTLTNRVQDYI